MCIIIGNVHHFIGHCLIHLDFRVCRYYFHSLKNSTIKRFFKKFNFGSPYSSGLMVAKTKSLFSCVISRNIHFLSIFKFILSLDIYQSSIQGRPSFYLFDKFSGFSKVWGPKICVGGHFSKFEKQLMQCYLLQAQRM